MVKIIQVADDGTEKAAVELDDFTVEVIYSGIADMLRDAETAQAGHVVPVVRPVARGAAASREGPDQDSRLSHRRRAGARRRARSLHRCCTVGRIADPVCYVHPGAGPGGRAVTGAAELRRRWWGRARCSDGGSVACWPRRVWPRARRACSPSACSPRRTAGIRPSGHPLRRHRRRAGAIGAATQRPDPSTALPPESFVTQTSGLPVAGEATTSGCSAALEYLNAYAAPGFAFECPGNARRTPGHDDLYLGGLSVQRHAPHRDRRPLPERLHERGLEFVGAHRSVRCSHRPVRVLRLTQTMGRGAKEAPLR